MPLQPVRDGGAAPELAASLAGVPLRPRLCLVFPHVLLGGGETAMMEVAEGLRQDFDLEVCALDNAETAAGWTIREELAARFGAVSFVRKRWELRPRFRAAGAVLWYGLVPAVPAALAAMAQRPASVRVVHTERPQEVAFARRWRRAIDGTVCVSPAMARLIPGAVFIPNTGSLARLQGPGQDFFPPQPRRKTLGFVGRLVPLKNAAWLVENLEPLGCNLLVQALDTSVLASADLARLAERRGVAERVRFLAPGRDVGTILRSVDAAVIVSRHEGFPMVAVEAGLLGVPVISTRVGALPELFAEEILFVDSEEGVPSLGSLRSAVAQAGPAWGRKLREKVSRLCAPDRVVARYAEVLRDLMYTP